MSLRFPSCVGLVCEGVWFEYKPGLRHANLGFLVTEHKFLDLPSDFLLLQ